MRFWLTDANKENSASVWINGNITTTEAEYTISNANLLATAVAGDVSEAKKPNFDKTKVKEINFGFDTTDTTSFTIKKISIEAVPDTTPPTLASISADVSATTTVVAEFNEDLTSATAANFQVKIGSATATAPTAAIIDATKKKVTLTIGTTFKAGDTVTVTLLADAVKDLADNANVADATGQSITISATTTATLPVIFNDNLAAGVITGIFHSGAAPLPIPTHGVDTTTKHAGTQSYKADLSAVDAAGEYSGIYFKFGTPDHIYPTRLQCT